MALNCKHCQKLKCSVTTTTIGQEIVELKGEHQHDLDFNLKLSKSLPTLGKAANLQHPNCLSVNPWLLHQTSTWRRSDYPANALWYNVSPHQTINEEMLSKWAPDAYFWQTKWVWRLSFIGYQKRWQWTNCSIRTQGSDKLMQALSQWLELSKRPH